MYQQCAIAVIGVGVLKVWAIAVDFGSTKEGSAKYANGNVRLVGFTSGVVDLSPLSSRIKLRDANE